MDEPVELPLAAALAGWRDEDLAWESLQERAIGAALTVEGSLPEAAAGHWADALRLARTSFEAGDPRLATSLANRSCALTLAGDVPGASRLAEEALEAWDLSAAWLAAMKPEPRARSSTFHLRLQAKSPGGWDHLEAERRQAIWDEGRARLLRRQSAAAPDPETLAAWLAAKPERFGDLRKLRSAALLIV